MIGMFDSGLGGLSVWRQLRHALPQQDVVYLADQGYCPYGERSQAEIIARAEAITAWLLQQGAQLLLIACNTATSAAARHLRERYPQLPIVGMEPAIKPAVLASQSGRVGVLATHATLQGDKFRQLVAQFAGDTLVVPQAGKGFVELVESGELDSERSRAVVGRALAPLLEHGVDHVVLGCTHYPFLAPLMRQLLPAHIDLIDPTDAVIRQTLRLMQQHGIATEDGDSARYRFVSTGQPPSMAHFLQHTLGDQRRRRVHRPAWLTAHRLPRPSKPGPCRFVVSVRHATLANTMSCNKTDKIKLRFRRPPPINLTWSSTQQGCAS